jgi:basic membrane lipoprotein Med (substrate-binding protein (PBP1-ABC) superfamily)
VITFDKIKNVRNQTDFQAQLLVTSEIVRLDYTLPIEQKQAAIKRLKQQVWDQVYGGMAEELQSLKEKTVKLINDEVFMMPSGVWTKIDELFQEVINKVSQ